MYKGTIGEHPDVNDLDKGHRFITNKPVVVCANTAKMLGGTWLDPHFEVTGDATTQYGPFAEADSAQPGLRCFI